MGKSACAALVAAFVLASCQAMPQPPAQTPPAPAPQTPQAEKPAFPPRPLTLLYTTFQDHAVLQRDRPIPVWGLAAPGADVEVTFAAASAHATADAAGNWRAELPAMPAGGPYELSAKTGTGQTQTVKDVMVGDVYLCSGQSNMEMPLRLATNYDSEMRSATNTSIRLFHVQRFASPLPRSTFGADASWSVTSPDNVKEFSAVCYYFGREIQPVAGAAVGLIEDAWGGAAIHAYIGAEKMRALGGYDAQLDVLPVYAGDPKAGEQKWREIIHAWWLAHDPASSASPPWSDPSYDDSAWQAFVPKTSFWSMPQMKDFYGTLWLRKSFTLSAAQAAGPAVLTIGPIHELDTTFVNGVEVGDLEGYDVKRVYSIPAGTLHEGTNLIAIGVFGGGGLLEPADQITLKLADGSVVHPGAGEWRLKTSAPDSVTGHPPHVPWLNQYGISVLYNGMIAPLGGTPIRGVVWYQGETDVGQTKAYARLMPALIADWRAKFGADTPFFVVQLPGYGPASTKPQDSPWAALREVQREVVEATPAAGLAVTIDLGSRDVIHPAEKQEVGRRLALIAERMVYGRNVVAAGPAPVAAGRRGKTVRVRFDQKNLAAYESNRVIGFALCRKPGDCRFTIGTIDKDSVLLDASAAPRATLVRFCWSDSPICNLYNAEGLPAVPFEMPVGPAPSRTLKRE